MEMLIDEIVSNSWIFFTLLLFLLGVAGIFFFAKPIKHQWINQAITVIVIGLFMYIMVFATRGSFGYAVEFTNMYTNGKHICLVERHEVGDGDGGSSTVYRLYTLDLKTGNRILRMSLDYSGIITMTNDGIIVYGNNRVVKLDIVTGDEIKTWTKEHGFEKFAELKFGINNIGHVKRLVNGIQKGYLTITALDGHEYYLDLQNETLHSGQPPYELNEQGRAFYFNTVSGKIQRLIKPSRDTSGESSYNIDMLLPEIIVNDPQKKILIVQHFTSLDKSNAVLTCLSYDLQPQWTVQQSLLNIKNHYEENNVIGTSVYDSRNLLITFGGTVICFDITSGNERWRNSL